MAGTASGPARTPQQRSLIVKLRYRPPIFSSNFNQSDAALALIIVKSRPKGLSLDEYLSLIKQNMRTGLSAPSPNRYIDSREFWKDTCNKFYKENQLLLREKEVLEERIRQLDRHIIHDVYQNAPSQDLQEDEGGDVDLDEAPRPRDTVENCRKHHDAWLDETEDDNDGIDLVTALEKGHFTMHAQVFQMAQQREALSTLVEADHDTRTVEQLLDPTIQLMDLMIHKVLAYCCDFGAVIKTNDNPEVVMLYRQSFRQIRLSFSCCFRALNSLCQNIPGRNKRFHLIERLVKFFEVGVSHLRTVSETQAKTELQGNKGLEPRHNRDRAKRHKGRADNSDGDYIISQCLSNLLASVLVDMKLQFLQPGHLDIIEGALCHILTEIGCLVSEIIFKPPLEASNSSIPAQITQLATQRQARHMLQILYAGLGRDDNARKNLMDKMLGGNGKPFDLSFKVKSKLQATLVKAIVGLGDGHDFRDSLKLPQVPDDILPTMETPDLEEMSPEWIINAVWTFVGTDMIFQETED